MRQAFLPLCYKELVVASGVILQPKGGHALSTYKVIYRIAAETDPSGTVQYSTV